MKAARSEARKLTRVAISSSFPNPGRDLLPAGTQHPLRVRLHAMSYLTLQRRPTQLHTLGPC